MYLVTVGPELLPPDGIPYVSEPIVNDVQFVPSLVPDTASGIVGLLDKSLNEPDVATVDKDDFNATIELSTDIVSFVISIPVPVVYVVPRFNVDKSTRPVASAFMLVVPSVNANGTVVSVDVEYPLAIKLE